MFLFGKKRKQSISEVLVLSITNINNFVGLAEDLSPESIVEYLNKFIDINTEIIESNAGKIIDIAADVIFSAWNSRDVKQACDASISQIQRTSELYEWANNKSYPKFTMRICVAIGECICELQDNQYISIFGDAVSEVNRIARVIRTDKNLIVVDNSVVDACKDMEFRQITDTEFELLHSFCE